MDEWHKYLVGDVHEGSMVNSWQREANTGRMDAFVAIFITLTLLGFMGYLMV